jgi:hypothetical protein
MPEARKQPADHILLNLFPSRRNPTLNFSDFVHRHRCPAC